MLSGIVKILSGRVKMLFPGNPLDREGKTCHFPNQKWTIPNQKCCFSNEKWTIQNQKCYFPGEIWASSVFKKLTSGVVFILKVLVCEDTKQG